MSVRERARMSGAELDAFLVEQGSVVCATTGPRGFPHQMPLWYVTRPSGPSGRPEIWAWTFRASQKVRNLERDARAGLLIETGDTYGDLRGAHLECDVTVLREPVAVASVGTDVFYRFESQLGTSLEAGVGAAVAAQTPKRVALRFVVRRAATWDHRKLGGRY